LNNMRTAPADQIEHRDPCIRRRFVDSRTAVWLLSGVPGWDLTSATIETRAAGTGRRKWPRSPPPERARVVKAEFMDSRPPAGSPAGH
jgi:hypothetical protein